MGLLLTPRWFEINKKALQHPAQIKLKSELSNRKYDNYVIAAGRRSFKTERFLKRYFVAESINNKNEYNYLGAPTRKQAKTILWKDLKQLSHPMMVKSKSESDLIIEYTSGSVLQVVGLQEFRRVQGGMAHRVGVTEYQDCDPEVFTESFEPMLNDTGGLWIEEGRPFGKNHFYDDFLKGLNNEKGWMNYHWTSEEVLSEEQIERAKNNLAKSDYEREYLASFETEFGAPYYAYSNLNHHKAELNPNQDILVMCDFNATEKPMSWNIGQVILHQGCDSTYIHKTLSYQFTNTATMCEILIDEFDELFGDKRKGLNLIFYGDYAGTHDTSNSSASDWEIIEARLRGKVSTIEKRIKPCLSIRDSVASTNARFCNANNQRRLFVNPEGCKPLILDFEKVQWKSNGRELDDKDDLRGHACRALDYYNDYDFPAVGKTRGYQP